MIREARIYLPTEDRPAIVAAVYDNHDSAQYEQEDPILVSDWHNPQSLVLALRSAIQRFTRRDRNLRDYKRTDWPAYRTSHCRSVNQFEAVYFPIHVRSVNEAELFYEASATPRDEDILELRTTLNRYGSDEEIGTRILRLFEVGTNWKKKNSSTLKGLAPRRSARSNPVLNKPRD